MPSKRRSAVFYVNGLTAVLLVVILAGVSLVSSAPAPPSISEFAPQANRQIEDAPDEQSAEGGEAAGAAGERETIIIESEAEGAGGESGDPEQETMTNEGVPSALACLAWPNGAVTQTFDPQSPPCQASWDAADGNGGATARGVTDTEILVAWPDFPNQYTPSQELLNFINSRYQLYGRNLVAFNTGSSNNPEQQRAIAAETIEAGAFASLGLRGSNPMTAAFVGQLTDNDVVVAATNLPVNLGASSRNLAFGFYQTETERFEYAAALICTSLAGRPAQHAGDPGLRGDIRQFAIVHRNSTHLDTTYFEELLRGCGVEAERHVVRSNEEDAGERGALAAQLRFDGVTTVIMVGDTPAIQQEASASGWFPEWVATATGGQFNSMYTRQDQVMFGIFPQNKVLRESSEIGYQAAVQGGSTNHRIFDTRGTYERLALLAAGIQAAGPNLTPQTFASGLRSMKFPNPGQGASPYFQGGVGLTPSNSLVNDVALFMWDGNNNEQHYGNGLNRYGKPCLVGGGSRFTKANMPADDSVFLGLAGC